MEYKITGKTKTFALIGTPVGHSGSPAMYNYCFQKLGFDCVYVALDVSLDRLPDAMAGIKAMGIGGINITMPCKSEVVRYMNDLSPAARLMGACNTAVNEDGRWIGHNTDGIGFVNNLKDHGVSVVGKRITLLGAGGAGTAIAVQAALSGAGCIEMFNFKDEFFPRAQALAENICMDVKNCVVQVHDLADEKALADCIAKSDILVNATRCGMAPNANESPIKDVSLFHPGLIVTDTVYNPRETMLLREAKAAGCKTVDGIGMLIHQGAAAFNLYTGAQMPVEEVREKFFS